MPKLIDLTGQRYGRLTVMGMATERKGNRPLWICKCDCGNVITTLASTLRNGKKKSCGCLFKENIEKNVESRRLDLTGKRFGKLVVLERAPNRGESTMWKCLCDCGNETVTATSSLRSGQCRSCGCLHVESAREAGKASATHGLSNGELYGVWINMKTRCYNKNNRNYARWGARGIYVCEEWLHDFKAFHDWGIANGYRKGLTLDRIDNFGPYSPENCRWATPRQQSQNTRRTRMITWRGETKPLVEWSKELGISSSTLCYRLKYATIEEAFSVPVVQGGKSMKNVKSAA